MISCTYIHVCMYVYALYSVYNVYVCIYIYYMYVYIHVYIYAYVNLPVCIYNEILCLVSYIYIYVYIWIYISIYVFIYICTFLYQCFWGTNVLHAYMYIYMFIHVHIGIFVFILYCTIHTTGATEQCSPTLFSVVCPLRRRSYESTVSFPVLPHFPFFESPWIHWGYHYNTHEAIQVGKDMIEWEVDTQNGTYRGFG